MNRDGVRLRLALAVFVPLLSVASARGADTITNSLTGFTGNSSVPATQTALAAANLEVSDLETTAALVNFGAQGVTFGNSQPVNEGRNYIRTVDDDYANFSFVAEITMVANNIDENNGYFGFGAGIPALPITLGYRTPDWTTPNSSVMYWGENSLEFPTFQTNVNDNTTPANDTGRGTFTSTDAPGQGNGSHRIQIAYDWFAKKATISLDINYAGGPFTADLTAPIINTLPLYGPDGWPTEPARVYFGGDRDVIFKDLSIQVSGVGHVLADFNSSGSVTEADWAILRQNQLANLNGKTTEEAYFLGDLNGDQKNDHQDFVLFKTIYEGLNGSGSFARMVNGVPEPSVLVLLVVAGACGAPCRWRRRLS